MGFEDGIIERLSAEATAWKDKADANQERVNILARRNQKLHKAVEAKSIELEQERARSVQAYKVVRMLRDAVYGDRGPTDALKAARELLG